MFDLDHGTQLLRLLSEPTRLRLLLLLESEPLTVAEITAATKLPQSRVSTHLGRLRQAGLVGEQRAGVGVLLSVDPANFEPGTRQIWTTLVNGFEDAVLREDRERAVEIARKRAVSPAWVESAAGRMESHYAPGRTWEATARALIGLLDLGRVLDIASGDGVLAELVGAHAHSVTCLDQSAGVLAAARRRLATRSNVAFERGDMHALPFADAAFEHVFLMHALTYTTRPTVVFAEAARVLAPGGYLVLSTLARHEHRATVAAYDHANLGFTPETLRRWSRAHGLTLRLCGITSREARPPYFQVATLIAGKPA